MSKVELEQARRAFEILLKKDEEFWIEVIPDYHLGDKEDQIAHIFEIKRAFRTALKYLERVGEMEKEILEYKEILEASYKDTQYFAGMLDQCQKRGVEHGKKLKEANAELARYKEALAAYYEGY